jgi:5-hydroxyisourate hydrolase-like protein (transthyretin family)
MANKKLLLLSTLIALAGGVYIWLQSRDNTPDLLRTPGLERHDEMQVDEAVSLADVPEQSAARVGIEASSPRASRSGTTTWGAQVVERSGRRALAGVALRVTLLSPDATRQDVPLVSGADGEVGPIEIEVARYPAAEVRVDPGAHWAGTVVTVMFAAGRANHDVIDLAAPATVTMTVRDTVRDAPLPGAEVAVHDASGLVAQETCDAQGVARSKWQAAGGPFSLRPSAPGYSAVSWAELAHPPSADLGVELLLAPEGRLDVRVQDYDGHPLARCQVSANVMADAVASAKSHQVRAATARWNPPTEASGVYTFAALPCEAPLVLRAQTQNGLKGTALARISAATAFAEVTLMIGRAEGTVVWTLDEGGGPLGSAKLGIEEQVLGTTDEAGRAILAFQESQRARELWAFRSGYAFAWQQLAPQQLDLIYRLAREGTVAGTVVDSAGRPQRLVRIVPLLGDRNEERSTRHRRGESLVKLSGANASGTDSSGKFTIGGLVDGWIDLYIRPPKGSPFVVRDVLVGTQDMVVTLPDEETLGRKQGIALSVAVLDKASGEPVSGASVTAFHNPGGKAQSLKGGTSAKTKADGTVRLTGAEHGHYVLIVSADGYVPYAGEAVDYPIGEHRVEVELAQACELEVLLVDAGGVPQAGYWLSAVGGDGQAVPFEHVERGAQTSRDGIMTDVKGRARANRMSTGRLTLEVRTKHGREGRALLERQVELIGGERNEVELRLP